MVDEYKKITFDDFVKLMSLCRRCAHTLGQFGSYEDFQNELLKYNLDIDIKDNDNIQNLFKELFEELVLKGRSFVYACAKKGGIFFRLN